MNKTDNKTVTHKAIKASRRLRSLVASYGAGWSVAVIDGEPVAYRDFGDGYDVEVSCYGHRWANVYLWRDRRRLAGERRGVDPWAGAVVAEEPHAEALERESGDM